MQWPQQQLMRRSSKLKARCALVSAKGNRGLRLLDITIPADEMISPAKHRFAIQTSLANVDIHEATTMYFFIGDTKARPNGRLPPEFPPCYPARRNMRQVAALPSLGGGRCGKIAAGAAIFAGAAVFLIVVAAALRSSPLAGPLSVRRHQGTHAHWLALCPTAARNEVPPYSANRFAVRALPMHSSRRLLNCHR